MPVNEFNQPVGEPVFDWQPRSRPQRVTLSGPRCRLEPLTAQHAAALWQAFQTAPDTRHWTWLPHPPPSDERAFHQLIADAATLDDPLHFAVIDAASQQPVGRLALMRIDSANGCVEVGHVHFSALMSRTPLATEAHWLLMRYVFDTLGYRRYEWKCDSLNAPSRKAALRLGFQFEGIFRQAVVYKGRNRDTAWFSIIDSEWPMIGLALTRWLAPENFSTDGQQRQRLEDCRTHG
ncbi:GNAT family N-acetyltransferase [Enterobacteriaceae bacterium 4M9]|nr:GNAT family N-acetyltransferase [Enterobacteriaceae bacterium 4M9]